MRSAISSVISSFSRTTTSSLHDVDDRVARDATADPSPERDRDLVALVDDDLHDAVRRAAVLDRDDDVLRDVRQLPRQVAGVGRLERRVGQALPRAVGGREVLEHLQALAEVRLDGRLDDLARRLGHQTAHPAELTHLVDRATRARRDHAEDRVDVAVLVAEVLRRTSIRSSPHLLTGVGPVVDDLEVALALGDDALLEGLLDLVDLLLGRVEDVRLRVRDADVVLRERQARAGRRLEAEVLEVVEQASVASRPSSGGSRRSAR